MSDNQVIPQASVDAAARIIYRTSGRKRVMSYEQARPTCEEEARLILEAAAPYMLAEAWEEGASDGQWNAEHIYQIDAGSRHAIPNPYKEEQ